MMDKPRMITREDYTPIRSAKGDTIQFNNRAAMIHPESSFIWFPEGLLAHFDRIWAQINYSNQQVEMHTGQALDLQKSEFRNSLEELDSGRERKEYAAKLFLLMRDKIVEEIKGSENEALRPDRE